MNSTGHCTGADIDYRAAPYGHIAVIPAGAPVVEAKNLPGRNRPRWWALPWNGMSESEEAWMRNYGFLLEDEEVITTKKKGVKTMEQAKAAENECTFTVCGTHGELTVLLADGKVIGRSPEEAYLGEVVRVDVDEWHRAYPAEKLKSGSSHDILDFGSWDEHGLYDEPAHSWRIERAEAIAEDREKSDQIAKPEYVAPYTCPQCGNEEVRVMDEDRDPQGLEKQVLCCSSCSTEWKQTAVSRDSVLFGIEVNGQEHRFPDEQINTETVEIHVRGGVAYGPEEEDLPAGIRVQIIDHDNELHQ